MQEYPYPDWRVFLHPKVLDQIILWKQREKNMQRTWKIEVQADFADEKRYEVISEAVMQAAALLDAKVSFGADQGVKPQVVAYSDDFFGNHETINLWAKKLGRGAANLLDQQDEVSDELRAAMREMQVEHK